jgi:ATP phosphoribosyltransferase
MVSVFLCNRTTLTGARNLKGLAMSPQIDPSNVRLALPKGRMFDQVVGLLKDAGISISQSARGYRPNISLPNFTAKILKPRNVISMLMAGARDVGFAGADWIVETNSDLVELLDTKMNPVRLVVAAPTQILENGKLPNRPIVVASEYPNLAAKWIEDNKLDAKVLTTFGATEVFPPEDADCIIDNTATGSTLRANGLQIIDEVLKSSTRLYASREAMENAAIKTELEKLVMFMSSVLEARSRVMMDLNVPQENLQAIIDCLPSMREPTVSPLSNSGWLAVRSALPREQLTEVIPKLRAAGACDIVTTAAEQIIQ